MYSWFLTRISQTDESADGSHKQLQNTEKILLNSHFVTADLWFENKFHSSTLQHSKTEGRRKKVYTAPHTVLTFEHKDYVQGTSHVHEPIALLGWNILWLINSL